jgi:queuine tRNA-ribosyltransferase
LFLAREMNGAILASLHNVAFYLALLREIRSAVSAGRLAEFETGFMRRFSAADEGAESD